MLRPAILIFSAALAVAGLTALNGSVQQTIIQNNEEPENVLGAAGDPEASVIDQAANALLQGRGDGWSLATSAYYLDLTARTAEDREAFLATLRQLVESRPANYYLWAYIARQELMLGRYEEAGAAYKMALRTGRHLPSTREWIIESGHDNWFYLSAAEREEVNKKVRALFEESPNAVAGLAYDSWRFGLMLDAFKDDPNARALFARRRALMHDPALRRTQRLPRS